MRGVIGTLLLLAGALTAQEVRPYRGAELIVEKALEGLQQRFMLQVAPEEKGSDLMLVIKSPEGEEILPLFDDGTHGDERAGDGVYTGVTLKKPGAKQRFFLRGIRGRNESAVYLEAVLFRF